MKSKSFWIIFALVLIAFVLRFNRITQIPPSLNWDEVSIGYNAYSILETGKDEWGVVFPTIFRAYGDYKLPVYIYLTAISEAVFGLTPFAVRLVSLLAGVVTVVFTYFLSRKLFNERVAIISSLLVAVSPWSLFLSRGAFEANLALAFVVSGFYYIVRGLSSPRQKYYLIVATILLGLSLWTYNSARIFVPIMFVTTIWIYRLELRKLFKENKSNIFVPLVVFLLFFIPMIYQLVQTTGQARYSKVTILDEGAINSINSQRLGSNYSPAISRLVYNKATYAAPIVIKNWLFHLGPNFLFIKGGDNFQFNVPGKSLLLVINFPFFIIGLFVMIKRRSKADWFILFWLLLGPVAASVTRDAPHTLRSIVMIPSPMIIISIGGFAFWDWLVSSKKHFARLGHVAIGVYLLLITISVAIYMDNYSNDYRSDYSWSWQYGYKEVVNYANENYDKYDKIIVTKRYGEPHEFFLFYFGWDPEDYRNDSKLNRYVQSGWYWVDSFDKYYFVNDWQINEDGTNSNKFNLESKKGIDCSGVKCLLITSPNNVPDGWNKLETINFLGGEPAFETYENI